MNSYPRGSEWRKWDLHLHIPTTKLSDGYIVSAEEDVWDKFCDSVEESDVVVFGITDYFSFDNYFLFLEKFKAKYPHSKKCFFPNVEIRLNESVNEVLEEVNVHLLFKCDVTPTKANEFMMKLKTEITSIEGRNLTCADLSTQSHYETAVITRRNISDAFTDTFGKNAVRQENMIIITAANNDGIRPTRGQNRKENITDEIDKFSDAYFGGSQNRLHFLKTDRLEDATQSIKAKPVFSSSDAHSFEQFHAWVGKTVNETSTKKEITWVKSNPTFDGLLQTLIEPDERVSISPIKPDIKEQYKVIESVKFSGTSDFPPEAITFNENLSSIIGSRSSGKSALLAYMAHSINAEETVERQLASQEGMRREDIGPAAGITWNSVSSITCEVVWASGAIGGGRVVYIPQNYLYSISNRPTEITQKVVPVLFKNFPDVKSQYEKTNSDIEAANLNIENAVNKWFDGKMSINRLSEEIKEIGSKVEIEKARDTYQTQINELKKQLSITDEDIAAYQALTQSISAKEVRKIEIIAERNSVLPFITVTQNSVEAAPLNVTVSFYPSIDSLPLKLSEKISEKISTIQAQAGVEAQEQVLDYYNGLNTEEGKLTADINRIQADNSELIEKNKQNNELAGLVKSVNEQVAKLTSISEKETLITEKTNQLDVQTGLINNNIALRTQTLSDLLKEVAGLDQTKYEITFGVEFDYDRQTSLMLADKFNRSFASPYIIEADGGLINMVAVRDDAPNFLKAIEDGTQRLKSSQDKKQTAKDVLCATEEIRFSATLEEDKIGGFALSSMTPGKRALFALTLILSETEGGWPLLIDQPEDDLDSRSIYEQIVPYIMQRKRERQIIMVSHNANLVVGADSEQIIVANKHGDDRKNRNDMTFDYLTGSLEDSTPKHVATCVLDTCGIREHACEILDGGEEAFEKRKDKYRL